MQNIVAKILLLPFSVLYGLGVSIRNFCYHNGILKGISFDLPVISVGNLTVGGAGKSPHVEYLIRLLKDYIDVATLSRGYGRKTKGFHFVTPQTDADQVGDEPLQFKQKYPEVIVTVAENRTFAIPEILSSYPDTQVVLLDDAFQHRSITPGFNILLTEFNYPFTKDILLPAGRLREWRSAYSRADIIIVSKCPPNIKEADRQRFMKDIKPFPHQKVFFSYYEYEAPYAIFDRTKTYDLHDNLDLILVCAIARSDYLLAYLEEQIQYAKVLEFTDHHYFNHTDMSTVKSRFEKLSGNEKIILTTEKDATRLHLHKDFILEHELPIYVLPIKVAFHGEDGQDFDQAVKDFLLNFRV